MIQIPPTDGHGADESTTAATPPAPAALPALSNYTIVVDRDLCIGAASCVDLATKTFALDGEQRAVLLEGAWDTDDKILAAAKSCPTLAIILRDRVSGEQVWPT